MNAILEQINSAGLRFVEFAPPMFVQSGVLILILLLADFALRKKVRAVFRYWIWMLVLVKLILPTSLSTPVSLGYFFGDELASVNINRPATEAGPPEPALTIVPPTIDLTNIRTDEFTQTPAPIIPGTETILTEPAQPPVESVMPLSWQGTVFILWLVVVLTMGLLLLQRAIFVRGLVVQAEEANDSMADTLESCREHIRVKRKIGLKVSANAASPAVCGLFRPVILVPKKLTLNLSSGQLRAVLLHELAHIRRGDLWVNLAQTLLQIIYFYDPLLWLANAIIRRTREQAVDEMVLVAMGEKAQQYPQTLVDVAKLAFKRPALSLRLIGVVESKSALSGRIKHILNRPMPKKAKLGILGLIIVIITAAILLPMATCTPGPPSLVIKGTVKDAQTGEPIAGARVFDDGYGPKPNWEQIKAGVRSEWGAITNSAGEYSFLTWAEHHTIKVEAPGYKSERQTLYDGHFTFNKKDVEIFNFVLEPEFKPPEMSLKAKPTYATDEPIELYLSWADNGWVQTTDNRAPENKGKWILFLRINGADYGQGEYPILVPEYITAGVVRQGRHFNARETYSKGKRIEFPPGRYRVSYVFKDVSAARPDEPQKVVHFGDIATNEVEFDVVEGDAVSSSGFAAKLAKGVKVELIGICEHPSEGKQWWRPDGSLLQEKPYGTIKGDRVFFGANEKAYEFVVRLAGPADVRVNWQAVPDSGSRMTSFPHDVDGKLLPDLRVLVTRFNKKTRIAQVRIGIAPKVSGKNVVQDDGWVEFKNVSLRPGMKTDVQVEVEGAKSKTTKPVRNSISTARRYFSRVNVRRTRDTELVKTLREDTELFDEPVGFLVRDYDDGVLHCIDFDNNRIVRVPDELDINNRDAILKWSKEHNIDALFRKASSLVSLNMASTIIAESEWSELSTRTLEIVNKRVPGSTDILYSAFGEYHYSAFKTSQGRIGVLGLASLENNGLDHRLLSIKYKLLRPDVSLDAETEKVAKTDAGITGLNETEARRKASSFIGCDLRASVQDVKLFSNSMFGTYQVLIRFDIAPEDLKNLMKNSDKLPDFPDLHKNPKIHMAMVETHKVLKIDWWKPGELKSPICAEWLKRKRAMGDPRVWLYRLLKICCSRQDNNLIRVYIDFFSEPDDMPFTNPDMNREIEAPKVWSQKLAGDVFAAIIANDNNRLEALNIDSGLLSALGGYRRDYDFSGLNRMVHYQNADRCFVIVSPIRHKEGKYPDQEIRFGFKSKQGIWVAGSIESGNIGDRDDFLKREGFEEFSRIQLTRKSTDRTPINSANNSAVQVVPGRVAVDWQYIGTAIPADCNETILLAEHITLDSIGQDIEEKVFITLLRDRVKTKNRQYRFILVRSDGRVVEPAGYKTLVFGDQLWERFSFDMPYHHRQIKEFRLQSFPQNLERKASLPVVNPYDPDVNGKITAQATSGPPGRGALRFDGQNDYLYVPDSQSLWLELPFTVEMWIKPEFPKEELENWPSWGLISKGCYIGTGRVKLRGFGITLNRFKDDPNLLMVNYCTADDNGIYGRPYGRSDFDDWIHLYHVFNHERYEPGHGYPLVVGKFLIPENLFAGRIGEIRIWAGARSRDQISEYKNKPLTGDEPGLVACWTFEQSGGQIAYDISTNRNHARLGRTTDTDDADPKWVDLKAASHQPAQKTDVQVDVEKADDKAQIKDVIRRLWKAIEANDIEEVAKLGPQGTFAYDNFDMKSWALKQAEEKKRILTEWSRDLAEPDDIWIRGDEAIALKKMTRSYEDAHVYFFVRLPDGWKLYTMDRRLSTSTVSQDYLFRHWPRTSLDNKAWREYLEAADLLHKGANRAELARRFSSIGRRYAITRKGRLCAELGILLADMTEEDKTFNEPEDVQSLPVKEQISCYIFKLRDVAEQELSIPGKCRVLSHPKTPNSPAIALNNMGRAVVPAMISLLNDRRPTRSVGQPPNGAVVLRYCDVALEIIEAISGQKFDKRTERGAFLSTADETSGSAIISRAGQWWRQQTDLNPDIEKK